MRRAFANSHCRDGGLEGLPEWSISDSSSLFTVKREASKEETLMVFLLASHDSSSRDPPLCNINSNVGQGTRRDASRPLLVCGETDYF